MDESWRRRLGMSSRTPRRTAKSTSSDFTRRRSSLSDTLDPEDFADVYGGPPQTVLLRRFSGEFVVSPPSFYDEVFRTQELASPAVNVGRSLKAFRIPETTESFFGDIFGSNCERRSRDRSRTASKAKSVSKSKSNSSSVLSSEELSPMRTAIDDAALSSFASKLRPINVPSRWNSPLILPEESQRKQQDMSEFPCPRSSPVLDDRFLETGYKHQSFRNGFSRQVTSPEAVSIEPSPYKTGKIYGEDVEINSPSSAVSSLCQETTDNFMADDEDDDEMSSSYVIEIESHYREEVTSEAIGVDDAIAWAKERFNAHRDSKTSTTTREAQGHVSENQERTSLREYLPQNMAGHQIMQSSQMELQPVVDGNLRSWSDGKEHNIRLLLSTLHQVLWPKSGWADAPLMSLKERSQVKKAYQKARLCLHPDKLQQRGATLEQKHIAKKVFSILQDAWDSFNTTDVFIQGSR